MTWDVPELQGWLSIFCFRRIKDIHTSTKGTVPNELRGYTKRTGDTEQDCVELHLS